MNIYLIGMIIAMVIFIVIGLVVSRKIKNVEDFYVAGRQAPVLLIAGSLIASYSSTGMFMGDAATAYDGALAPMLLLGCMQGVGYVLGGTFFGRYLRRSRVLTIPEFFGKRFDSGAMRTLAAVTAIVTMTVYLLSVMQGIGTLMQVVTGVDYRICILGSIIVITLIAVLSGSRGVLITDTMMAAVFTIALIAGIIFIAVRTGGWYNSIENIAANPELSSILSWGGKEGALGFAPGWQYLVWGLDYGIVWGGVCMVGPWQASRYQMAKDEGTVIRSSYWAALFVPVLEICATLGAVMVRNANPAMENSSHVLIWASMNLMPTLLGVVLLTGILSAGISSATTFQSLIGASVANDVFGRKNKVDPAEEVKGNSRSIRIGRIAMILAAVIVLAISVFNPPAIFVIMFLGGSIVTASWLPVAIGSIFSKRLTKTGAFVGMLAGFCGCFFVKLITTFMHITLPAYLDPSIIGMVMNIIGMIIGSAVTKVTEEEKQAREALFVVPDSEKDPKKLRKTLKSSTLALGIGAAITIGLLILWVIPYIIGSRGL